ncbi:MAG: flagellar biosynthetic protein FliO [Proteobacteria bacterium]|nr:flagellar biosynthetic protein FliO [Pseudomonadota bacterium]
MRNVQLATLALTLLLPSLAVAAPSFEILDRGDAVEIVAHEVKATRTAVVPTRQRLEVAIAGFATATRLVPKDATVRQVEFDGGPAARVLSVKLGFERDDVRALARFAQTIQVGDDLHILIPRHLPVDGKITPLPEPTLPATVPTPPAPTAPTAKTPAAPAAPTFGPARPEPTVAPEAPRMMGPTATAPLATEGAEPVPASDPRPAVGGAVPTKPATASIDDPSARTAKPVKLQEQTGSGMQLVLAGGLCLVGLFTWLMRKRRASVPQGSTIEVVAQRSLGGKAKIVWLTAGGREMVVAVTPQKVQMLGQWGKPTSPHSATTRSATAQNLPEARTPHPPAPRPTSSAVAGILKLRGTTVNLNEEVVTGDYEADELWAREMLAAQGIRR